MAALALTLIAAGLSAGSQIAGGIAARRTARDTIAEGNRLATDARDRGLETERNYSLDLAQLVGQQRTGMAAQGVDLTQGSAAGVLSDTKTIGEMDIATIRANVAREARGITANAALQARGLRSQATSQFAGAGATLLFGAGDAWGSYKAGSGAGLRALPSPGGRSNIRSGFGAPAPVTAFRP